MSETEEEEIQRLVKEGIAKAKKVESEDEEIQRLIKEGIAKVEIAKADKVKVKPKNSVRNFVFAIIITICIVIIAVVAALNTYDATTQSNDATSIVFDNNNNIISWGSQSDIVTDKSGNIIYTRDTCMIYLSESRMKITSDFPNCTQEDIKQWSNAQGYKPITSTSTVKATPRPVFPTSTGDGGAGITDPNSINPK